jgi:peptide chain release factor subunit 1
VAVLDAELVQRLARFRNNGQPVVSLYLDVDGREKIRREDYLLHLDGLLKDAFDDGIATSDLERIRTFVSDEFVRESTRGLAIFSSGSELWEVVTIPVPVSDHLAVNSTPHVRQLETIIDEHSSIGVLMTDRQRARMLVLEFGQVVERDELIDPLPRHDDDKGDWLKDHVKAHADESANQHVRKATQAMFSLYQRHPFERLVLCVPDDLRSEAERVLHNYLRSRLVGTCALAMSASEEEVVSVALEHASRAEREQESQYVERLRAAVLANEAAGRTNGNSIAGVAGLDHTLKAVFDKRVDTLLVSEGFAAEGWRCRECGLIATLGRICSVCGAEMELVHDVVEEAVEDALGQKCHVEFCFDNADLDVLGRIGALLRF